MALEEERLHRAIPPSRADSIRIVALNIAEELTALSKKVAQPVPPNLTYRGGPLMTSVEVFTIFWGAAWNQATQAQMAGEINQFFQFVLSSSLIDQLSEYSVPNYAIGHGTYAGTTTIVSPALAHRVTDKVIQHVLQHEIATNAKLPQPSPNTLYFIYLPPGVSVSAFGGRSCMAFCGYHDDIGGQIFYAVMPFPNCVGCDGSSSGLTPLEALTSTSSHELCEAITDPVNPQGWYDDNNGEIGDICAWKTKKLDQYVVQLEWSNKANSCK